MVKLLLGTMALVGVLGFVACNSGGDPKPPVLADCPATITIGAGNVYSIPSCQLKVGASVIISASGQHPLIGKGNAPLILDTKTTDYSFAATASDVGKTFEYQCSIHGPSMSGSIKVVAAM
jgi:plastocyanin